MSPIRILLLTGLCLGSGAASAHPGHADGFAGGLLHPLLGIDHLLALLAVGWWSSAPGMPRWWAPPLVFASSMAGAALLTAGLGWHPPAVELQIGLSLLILGLLVASARHRLPSWVALPLCGVLALGHGAAHGAELGGPAAPWLLGMLIATLLLHLGGAVLGRSLRRRLAWSDRLAGAGLMAFAAATLWGLLA